MSKKWYNVELTRKEWDFVRNKLYSMESPYDCFTADGDGRFLWEASEAGNMVHIEFYLSDFQYTLVESVLSYL